MNSVSGTQRLAAIAFAISVTFSMVWSLASLGYPASSSATLSVCRGS
jgi:hypothetical protein